MEKMWSVFRDFLRSHAKAHHLDKEIIHASPERIRRIEPVADRIIMRSTPRLRPFSIPPAVGAGYAKTVHHSIPGRTWAEHEHFSRDYCMMNPVHIRLS